LGCVGGTHEIGFKAGVTRVLNDFVKKQNLYKGKNGGLIGEDFREGMTAVISVKMNNVQFEGQTKTKLGNTEARTAIESIVSEGLQHILEDIDNQSTLEMILNKAISTAMVREAARKAKDLTRKKNSLESIKQNVVTEAATVNEIVTAVATGQVDAAIVTEDAIRFNDKVEMVDIPKDQNIDQIIPACTLKSSEHQELAQKLVDFIASEEGKAIFEKPAGHCFETGFTSDRKMSGIGG